MLERHEKFVKDISCKILTEKTASGTEAKTGVSVKMELNEWFVRMWTGFV
jgi:hypothetical protein